LFHGERESFDSHLWWAVGLVQNETQFEISAFDRFGLSGRFAYAWRDQESLDLLHLGVSFLNRPVTESVRFLERPESHIAGIVVDTYASNNAKLQLNGIRATRQGLDPFWIWQIRLQFDY